MLLILEYENIIVSPISVKKELNIIKKCWVKNGLNIYNYKIKEAGILANIENYEISTSLEK